MQGEGVGSRLATWVAGVLGVWAGLAALASLVAALMFPHWALVREPIVLAESPSRSLDFNDVRAQYGGGYQASLQPVVTTVTFRLGLWTTCPRINTSNLHMAVGSTPCSAVGYSWEHITHQDLHLPAPAPLVQTVVARMRLSTPFLMLACGLLTIGNLMALIGRCCYSHASLVAALMYSLGGLSVGVGVVWFVSVISEEYGIASGRRTSWATMYAYRYGWSLMAAGGGGVSALIAALLTGHSHLSRHAPLISVLRTRSSSTDESLARPLLRCRSEGCLGQRSFTSDTIRTYLTCDSRRYPVRGCPPLHLPHSHSIVDLTKPVEDIAQSQDDHKSESAISRRSSKGTILEDDSGDLNQHMSQHQYHLHHQHCPQQHHPPHQHQLSQVNQQHYAQKQNPQINQQQSQQTHIHPQKSKQQQFQQHRGWSADTSMVIIESPRGVIADIVPPPPVTQALSPVSPVPPPPPLSSSSSSSSQLEAPPPPLPPSTRAGTVSKRANSQESNGSRSTFEPMRLPEYNSFTAGDYSRTLPTEGRQMAVFNRRSSNRSSTLTRSSTKISSEV